MIEDIRRQLAINRIVAERTLPDGTKARFSEAEMMYRREHPTTEFKGQTSKEEESAFKAISAEFEARLSRIDSETFFEDVKDSA